MVGPNRRNERKRSPVYVTIDPGLQTGWAIWNVSGLVACGLGDPRLHARHVVHSSNRSADTIGDVWVESPVIYPRSKARPADIMKLAREAGRWIGIYSTLGVEAHLVEPAQWKGQVPKDIHHARVWAALTSAEQALVSVSVKVIAPSKRHNVLDAVGLGLWVAERAGRS